MKTIHLSFRRYFLDYFLKRQTFHGDIIDIGGKKENTRGSFRPPLNSVNSWKFCNIDSAVAPDFLCSASEIPVPDSTFDIGLICEVIEHLESPRDVLKESFRILKPNGKLIGSVPFMYPRHADPYDFQRWTELKLRRELQEAGFENITVFYMGGTLAVIWDMVRIKCEGSGFLKRISRLILKFFSYFILKFYERRMGLSYDNTSGFFFIAERCR